ncbi:MAG: TOBE-like domain-containing protein [Vicinamibacterales bacterium]
MTIDVLHVRKQYAGVRVLNDVSLTVREGELVALLGPSGSGKTTLLRIMAGLEEPDGGVVSLGGADAALTDARRRRVGFVFQHYALFRHMTVFENIAFGLRVRPRATRPDEAAIRSRVQDLLGLVQLDYLGDRFPSHLSGGQRQRVALARALAVEPSVLLLDEPFGALDAHVRRDLRQWLRRLHDDIHLTSVFVTHDQDEALELADRVVVMRAGRIEQEGTPDEVVEQPATPFVMTFVGQVNVVRGRGREAVACADGPDALPPDAYFRPHDVEVSRGVRGTGLWATVEAVRVMGALARLELLDEDGTVVRVELGREAVGALAPRPGERVWLSPRRVRMFAHE